MNSLSIHYQPEDGSHGELTVAVRCEEFAGKASAWFNLSQLEAFERALGAFPIEAGHAPLLEGGIWHQQRIDQLHLRILIAPLGRKGALGVNVLLAKPVSAANAADTHGEISVRFPVTYGDLARFQSALRDHLQGAADAVLQSSSS